MKVLIVGAGIGGLAVAQALVRDGRDVTVFERASARREGGAAVTLWSNGTGVLEAMNVSLDGIGQRIDVLEQHDHQGTLLLSVDVAKAASRFGHPHICLPRRQLLGRLADGLPATLIRYGQACAHIARDGSGVRVELADGAVEYGDVLIGADGRSSVVRDVLWGRDPTEPSGWATWQGVTAISHEITSSHRGVLFSGPAGLCGLMPAGEGLLQWWFDQRWTPDTPMSSSPLSALRERFGDWATPVRDVLAAAHDDDVGFFPHYRHKVPGRWGKGPMTLVGDAAHSFPPTRAQGANQAMEDAWALAVALRRGGDLVDALRSYEDSRAGTAQHVAKQADREGTNESRPWMAKLLPDALAARLYTRWLRQASTFLQSDPSSRSG